MPLPRPVGDLPDQHEWLHDFIFGLFPRAADPIDQALDRMQHGLSDILNECPSLKDPAKGGRLQMKHFRVRMLTMEMIAELAQAYRNWPFKAPGSDHKKFFWNKGGIMRGSAQP
jgi:transcription factor 1